jgi:hypothetical protein
MLVNSILRCLTEVAGGHFEGLLAHAEETINSHREMTCHYRAGNLCSL